MQSPCAPISFTFCGLPRAGSQEAFRDSGNPPTGKLQLDFTKSPRQIGGVQGKPTTPFAVMLDPKAPQSCLPFPPPAPWSSTGPPSDECFIVAPPTPLLHPKNLTSKTFIYSLAGKAKSRFSYTVKLEAIVIPGCVDLSYDAC